jgi:hypothetical protein
MVSPPAAGGGTTNPHRRRRVNAKAVSVLLFSPGMFRIFGSTQRPPAKADGFVKATEVTRRLR